MQCLPVVILIYLDIKNSSQPLRMGNNKPNAYALYVSHVYNQKRKANEHVNKANLFHELGEVWSKLSAAEKQKWKDRAKSDNYWQDNGSQTSQQHRKASEAQPSHPPNGDIKPDMKPDMKLDIKPNLKRAAEDDVESSDSKALVQAEKRLKPGVPRGQVIVEGKDTYCDFHLLQLRDQCDAIIRSRDTTATTTPIYSISTNVLCKCKAEKKENKTQMKDVFIPIEICVSAYTIRDGTVGLPFHVLIDAGDIPMNHYNKSHDHAKLHKISIPPQGYPATARKDYRKIYKQLYNYTEAGERVLLVADNRDLEQVQGSIEWLYERAKEENINKRVPEFSKWTFLPLVDFIALTYDHIYLKTPQKHVAKFIHYYIKLRLDGCSLDHNPNMMCRYHQAEKHQTKWCAQVCAKKAFMNLGDIFEIICKHDNMCRLEPAATAQVLSIEG